jgi:hypothetical protein
MKICLKNLDPNPFREHEDYPILEEKVRALMASIKSTGFWDNVLARPSPTRSGRYQLAYGHHRVHALERLYGKDSLFEIDIPVRQLDDRNMLRIMANENAHEWKSNTTMILATLRRTMEYLQNHPEELQFKTLSRGISWPEEISAFLGGTFTETMVRNMLVVINAVDKKEVDEKAIKMLDVPTKALHFVHAVRRSERPISTTDQQATAKAIKEERVAVADIKDHFHMRGYKQERRQHKPDVTEFLKRHVQDIRRIHDYVEELARYRTDIPLRSIEWINFRDECMNLQRQLTRLLANERRSSANGHKVRRPEIGAPGGSLVINSASKGG